MPAPFFPHLFLGGLYPPVVTHEGIYLQPRRARHITSTDPKGGAVMCSGYTYSRYVFCFLLLALGISGFIMFSNMVCEKYQQICERKT